jgi:SAM-dependent methyltransferase
VDWKQGAREYFCQLLVTEGIHNRRYELVKPFQGGPNYTSFYDDMYAFVTMVEKLNLPPGASILDVGCGGGWVSHYLAKLGYRVTGVDICDELLAIAKERIESDPYPPYVDKPFETEFVELDIEAEPMPEGDPFDCVLFLSSLHHFYNPIQAIRHSITRLKSDGCLAIMEASAPEPGSEYDETNRELMEKYGTLERPLSRSHLIAVLDLCGFVHRHFYQPVNGLFLPNQASLEKVRSDILKQNWNCVVSSRSPEALSNDSIKNRQTYKTCLIEFQAGFYDAEIEENWGEYRWAAPEACFETTGENETIEVELQCVFMDPDKDRMKVFVSCDDTILHHLILTKQTPTVKLTLETTGNQNRFVFMADYVFRPDWFGIPDKRALSYKLRLIGDDTVDER